ncbi:hypothetical protein D3C75_1108520 [compost metagenome]
MGLAEVSPSSFISVPPGSLVRGGKRWLKSRPTIREMIRSVVNWEAGQVPILAPSRMMVTSSEMRRISSILCEI